MKVDLLAMDGIAVAKVAAACCTSPDMPDMEDVSEGPLLSAIGSGHLSVLEHITASFAIEGVSRVTETQLVRHRLTSFSIRSGRYCEPSGAIVTPVEQMEPEDDDPALPRMTREHLEGLKALDDAMKEAGISKEDRRYMQPQGMATNIVMTCNLRELSHILGLRLCKCAQDEMREMAEKMSFSVSTRLLDLFLENAISVDLYDALLDLLEPQCQQLGYCPEKRTCGAMPTLDEICKVLGDLRDREGSQ